MRFYNKAQLHKQERDEDSPRRRVGRSHRPLGRPDRPPSFAAGRLRLFILGFLMFLSVLHFCGYVGERSLEKNKTNNVRRVVTTPHHNDTNIQEMTETSSTVPSLDENKTNNAGVTMPHQNNTDNKDMTETSTVLSLENKTNVRVTMPHQNNTDIKEILTKTSRNHADYVHNEMTKTSLNHSDYVPPKNIFWLHIEKTGTSFFNTIYLHFCPDIVSKHHSIIESKKPLMDMELLRRYPPETYCNSTIRNMPCPGCHHPYGTEVLKKDIPQLHYFTMLRDPMERLKSAYSFGRHHSRLNASISFDTYVNESHIPNCQLKMVLGLRCAQDVDPQRLNITLALERIASPNFFFGITDQWNESICLFHSHFGGTAMAFELKNNRKTERGDETNFKNYTFAETLFYHEAKKVFDDKIRIAGC